MDGEFGSGKFSGGDGDRLGADGACASDIVRGIAEDKDGLRRKFVAVFLVGSCFGEVAELIAVVVIVGEGAELEVVPEAVVAEFDFGTAGKIASEEGEDDICSLVELCEERDDSGEELASGLGDFDGQMVQVSIQKGGDVFDGLGKLMSGENFASDPRVGPSSHVDVGKVILDAEVAMKAEAKGPYTSSTRGEDRAVDVEEKKFFRGHE